jgi:hypothetical protein
MEFILRGRWIGGLGFWIKSEGGGKILSRAAAPAVKGSFDVLAFFFSGGDGSVFDPVTACGDRMVSVPKSGTLRPVLSPQRWVIFTRNFLAGFAAI